MIDRRQIGQNYVDLRRGGDLRAADLYFSTTNQAHVIFLVSTGESIFPVQALFL